MGIRLTTDADLTSVANAIRTAGGTLAELEYPTEFVGAIEALTAGGVTIEDTVDTNGGIVRSITTVSDPLVVQSKTNIVPGTSDTTVEPDTGYAALSSVGVKGDANLIAGNIKQGTTIFNVTGTYSGPPPVVKSDVNFIDYDGTLLYSYTAADFANLSAMPANPSHTGLTAQGWNWSLSDAKTYVASYGKLWIGQMYITDDGKTRLYIHIADIARNEVPLYWYQSASEGVTINWGDGSVEETFSGTEKKNTTHTYTSAGDYVITLDVTSGTAILGYGTSSFTVLGEPSKKVYLNMLQKVSIGSKMDLYSYAFKNCYSLASVTIPDNVTSIGINAFNYCCSLASITIPDGITTIGNSMFNSCFSLVSVTIPDSVISIGSSAFYYCCSLVSITIPDSVTSIDNSAFYYCYSLTNITIPDSITSINGSMLYYCYSLASITIPDSITSIDSSAFSYCYSLASVTIPDNVTSIGINAFGSCSSLASITIPDGVTNISGNAFNSCTSIAKYHLLPEIPPTLANISAFSNIPSDCIIYVPYSADHSILAAYKGASNWSTYADYMQEEPQ